MAFGFLCLDKSVGRDASLLGCPHPDRLASVETDGSLTGHIALPTDGLRPIWAHYLRSRYAVWLMRDLVLERPRCFSASREGALHKRPLGDPAGSTPCTGPRESKSSRSRRRASTRAGAAELDSPANDRMSPTRSHRQCRLA